MIATAHSPAGVARQLLPGLVHLAGLATILHGIGERREERRAFKILVCRGTQFDPNGRLICEQPASYVWVWFVIGSGLVALAFALLASNLLRGER